MKTLLPLTLLAASIPCQLSADSVDDIQISAEAVTGFRSSYVYRGFELAESTLDFQLEAEIALNDATFLNLGAWYATETGSGDFDEAAFFAHLRFQKTDQLTLGLSATYRAFSHSTPPSKAVTQKAIFSLKTGVSYVDSYYGRDGFNDAYGRASLTYLISETVSVTPFVGGSILLDDNDAGDDKAFAGIWFEVRF